jgi:acyl homoserine lactone synthase
MLFAISYKEITRQADLFFGQHQLRHKEFIDRQGYDVKTIENMEFDQYDTLASHYLVYSDDGKHVLGASRLTPIEFGCMLQDHFPDLVTDHSIFSRPDVWEGTRFCIDHTLPPEKRLHVLKTISLGYLEFALARGIDQIIGLMPTLILRSVFERNGIELARLGDAKAIGAHSKIQAASISITWSQYERAQARTGMTNVLQFGDDQGRSRHVA